LQTGGGKSLMFMAPSLIGEEGTSVVIVPLKALKDDIIYRCKKDKISCTAFSSGYNRSVSVLVATVEQAVQKDFLEHLAILQAEKQLKRIVIDEAHQIVS
ncbi:hypothetical protein BJ508DRAFT_192830, partial [Ascobolus immersus RN42]